MKMEGQPASGPTRRSLFTSCILFAAAFSLLPSACSLASDRSPARADKPISVTAPVAEPVMDPSAWRSSLWEAMPAEWLRDSKKTPILEGYQASDWNPIFINGHFELNGGAQALIERLHKLEDEAIDPKPYQLDSLQKSITGLQQIRSAHMRNANGVSVADAAGPPPAPGAQYASLPAGQKEKHARMDPQAPQELLRAASEVDLKLARLLTVYTQDMNPFGGEEVVNALAGRIPMNDYLASLEPKDPTYRNLLKALARSRQAPSENSKAGFSAGPTLRPGDTGAGVRELQRRLQSEGYYSGKQNGVFDQATKDAVVQFQNDHQMTADGAVGESTRELLGFSGPEKASMIVQGIRQIRQSQTRRFDRYIRINIPQFVLEYHKDGKIQETHRVIVGKSKGKKTKLDGHIVGENQTPPLTSAIERVIINPRWYVTPRIRLELSDDIANDPGYFARHGYVTMSSQYSFGAPRIFQMPGPKNSLGQIKFEFPNPYAVFLHDTPNKNLFQKSKRDLSHGCVRVEKARELAVTLLSDDNNPAAGRTQAMLSKLSPSHIQLKQPVPIVIEYAPVSATENGKVQFFGDPYGILAEGKI